MAVWMSISFAVDDSDEFVVDPNMDRLFGNFGYALWFAGTTIALLVVLCVALVGLRGQLIPKWLAWVSVLVADHDARLVRVHPVPDLAGLGARRQPRVAVLEAGGRGRPTAAPTG